MIVLAREVFLCKCATEVQSEPGGSERSENLRFVTGSDAHFDLLDREHHDENHIADFRARLARGEYWLIGLLGDRIATYTWLHTRPSCEYPYLPGCAFGLPDTFGYGYDAWTPPSLRGGGLRRQAFVEELRVLSSFGKAWEASYFVAHQLEGARRSLARARVTIVPLWRVALDRGAPARRRLIAERVEADGGGARPEFPVTSGDE
jgi:hypothetical protein